MCFNSLEGDALDASIAYWQWEEADAPSYHRGWEGVCHGATRRSGAQCPGRACIASAATRGSASGATT